MIECAFCVINLIILSRDGRTLVRTRVRFGYGVSDARFLTSDADTNSNKIMTSDTDMEEHVRKPRIRTNIGHARSFVNNWQMSPIFNVNKMISKIFMFIRIELFYQYLFVGQIRQFLYHFLRAPSWLFFYDDFHKPTCTPRSYSNLKFFTWTGSHKRRDLIGWWCNLGCTSLKKIKPKIKPIWIVKSVVWTIVFVENALDLNPVDWLVTLCPVFVHAWSSCQKITAGLKFNFNHK